MSDAPTPPPTASAVPAPSGSEIFDRRQRRRQWQRAAQTGASDGALLDLLVDDLLDRLALVNRRFTRVLDLGCHDGRLAARLAGDGVSVVATEVAPAQAVPPGAPLVVCEPDLLPFRAHSFDLVVAAGSLHWVNDLPGALAQIRHILVPDGLFLATFPGGASLAELRHALLAAEEEVTGGAAARVSPMVDMREGGALLQRAGFAMPVADCDRLTLTYAHPMALLAELRAMGETNALARRARRPLRRDVLARACALYEARFGLPDGRVAATLEVVTLMGWAPGPNQPVPKRPGSATVSLADVLEARTPRD